MANTKKAYSTPLVTVRYAYLVTPSTTHKKEGEYVVKVAVEADSPEHAAIKTLLDDLTEKLTPKATAELKPAQKKKLAIMSPVKKEIDPETGEETGWYTIRFGMKAKVKRKSDGKVFHFEPDLFDAAGEYLGEDDRQGLNIGFGSKVRVSFTADRAYCMEGEDMNGDKFYKAGVSIDLKAVKIVELKSAGADAAAYGFDEEEDEGSFTKASAPKRPANDFDDDFDDDAPLDGDF